MRGRFITFEGTEGCGKTTQIRMAGEFLRAQNMPCIVTEEPGGTALGAELRKTLLNRATLDLCREAELFLFLADRAQHVREIIRPALREGKWVLCDRFSDATIAYQGFGRGMDPDFIRQMCDLSSDALKPDRTLLFDLPVDVGLRRALDRASRAGNAPAEDRFEREALNFHERVREGYLYLARQEPERFRVIDGGKAITDIFREVSSHLPVRS
jgi:dTMP kinase